MDKTLPLRPTHTGSARSQVQRGRNSHHVAQTAEVYRQAKHPLRLASGSLGVALRQVGSGKIEMKVQTRAGAVYWRAADEVALGEAIVSWIRRGF